MSDVYAAPTAELNVQEEVAQTRFWSLNDRIGRLRYMVYLISTYIIVSLAVVAIGIYISRQSLLAAMYVPMMMPVLHLLLSILYGFVFARRRLRDMNAPWGWSLLSLIPFVHFVVDFVLLFPRGTPGPNDYGLPPSPNSVAVRVLAWMLPILMLLLLVASDLMRMDRQYPGG